MQASPLVCDSSPRFYWTIDFRIQTPLPREKKRLRRVSLAFSLLLMPLPSSFLSFSPFVSLDTASSFFKNFTNLPSFSLDIYLSFFIHSFPSFKRSWLHLNMHLTLHSLTSNHERERERLYPPAHHVHSLTFFILFSLSKIKQDKGRTSLFKSLSVCFSFLVWSS